MPVKRKKAKKRTVPRKKPGPKPKRAGGRPTMFSDETQGIIRKLTIKGMSIAEVADVLGVSGRTLYRWQKNNEKFCLKYANWKIEATKRVEKSMFEAAIGYEHPELKLFNHNGQIIQKTVKKKYPPNERAGRFILTNRMPDEYRERSEVDITTQGKSIVDRIREQKNQGGKDGKET